MIDTLMLSRQQSQALLNLTALVARLEAEGLDELVIISPRMNGVFITGGPGLFDWHDVLLFLRWEDVDAWDFAEMLPRPSIPAEFEVIG